MNTQTFAELTELMGRLADSGATDGKISVIAGFGSLTAYFPDYGSINIVSNAAGDCHAIVNAGLGPENEYLFDSCHAAEVLS